MIVIHSKGRDKGHAHMYSEYFGNGDRSGKVPISVKQQVIYGFSAGIFTFDLSHFKDQGYAYFIGEYLQNGDI